MKHSTSTNSSSTVYKWALSSLSRHFLRTSLLVSLIVVLGGCPAGFIDDDYHYDYKPVYMSYDDLRSSVHVQDARPLATLGRVYLYDNYFFLNERNSGIHVFDNTNPSAPVNSAFISIPGNTELAIKDGFLYADSYVDLITIDLNNPAAIEITDRVENVFPWDPYQNTDDLVFFDYDQLDESKGVIIGYE